jgi:hypothetical protein
MEPNSYVSMEVVEEKHDTHITNDIVSEQRADCTESNCARREVSTLQCGSRHDIYTCPHADFTYVATVHSSGQKGPFEKLKGLLWMPAPVPDATADELVSVSSFSLLRAPISLLPISNSFQKQASCKNSEPSIVKIIQSGLISRRDGLGEGCWEPNKEHPRRLNSKGFRKFPGILLSLIKARVSILNCALSQLISANSVTTQIAIQTEVV